MVEREVRHVLEKAVDKVATELEREERKRIAAEQKEAEKAANARKREVARKQREIEKECLNILEKLVKRVEKDNDYEESGQPYVEGRLGKTAHKTPCFKVHGIPCLEYLAVQPQGVFMGIRNAEVEAAVRAAVAHEKGLLREAHQRHSHMLTLAKAPPRLGKGLNLKWVDPRQSGRPWTVICMRHVPKEPRPPAAAPSTLERFTAPLRHLAKSFRNLLLGTLHDLHQLPRGVRVVLGEEAVRLTLLTRAPRASNPVNVVLNREGKIVN